MGHKVGKKTHNISDAFGLETANIQCTGGSRRFAKETEALKMRSVVAHRQWKPLSKLILLQLQEKLPKNSGLTIYGPLVLEANHKGETAQWVGASQADWKSKKSSLWSVIFSYSAQQ